MSATARYEREARRVQARARVPALTVAVHRADRPLWTFQVGGAPDARFRIGSVTKTFTAVLVLQCRDDGLLDLDDPLSAHLDVSEAAGRLTLARLLSHTAGLQREPFGDVWDTLRTPDDAGLLADLARAEQVLPPGRRYHYSNLAFALLGRVVAARRGTPWAQALRDRVLVPLGLSATTVEPTGSATTGYLVDAYSDHVRPEPVMDCGAIGPAAQLWSTAEDMARWAGFLADPATLDPGGGVLAAATVDEMRWPRTVTDEQRWGAGFGLGLLLVPQGGQRIVHIGHDGAMPGFLAAVYGRRPGDDVPAGLGVAALGSSGTASELLQLPHTLLAAAVEHDPPDVPAWRPGTAAPAALRTILGPWWTEGYEYIFFWRNGRLRARTPEDRAGTVAAVFVAIEGESDVLRTESGRETGELLRLTRDDAGNVVRMHWATYRMTRRQETFDGVWAAEP
jgi:CubicO group peptidase (beta-lactamase class C family)